MNVIGLTGGIATGKSTVGRMLADEHGVPVIDADQVARDVVRPGQPALQAIVDRFGLDVLDADGELDRSAMRHRIAKDPEARRALEGITHPAIRSAIAQRLAELTAAGTPHAVVEAALLVETGSYRLYPTLIVVTCRPETQLRRLVERDGMDADGAKRLIATQLPLAEKERVATHLVRNDGDLAALRRQVAEVWSAIRSG